MDAAILGAGAAATGVPLAFALFKVLFPLEKPAIDPAELPALAKRYFVWDLASVGLLFVFAGVLVLGWYLALRTLAAAVLPAPITAGFTVPPDDALWLVIAIFLGLVTAAIPLDLSFRRLLGERYAEYMAVSQAKHGFDGVKVFAGLAVLIGLACSVLLVLGLDTYAHFGPDGVVINDFGSLGARRYAWSRVRAVRAVRSFRAPNGNVIVRPHFSIVFDDGSRWTTRSGGRAPVPEDERLARFAAERSDRSIDLVEIEND